MLSQDGKFEQKVTSEFPDFQGLTGFQIFLKRLELLTKLEITLGATIFIGMHIENPGQAVMYAYYIHRKYKGGSLLTLNELTSKIFPWGMLSPKQFEEMWDAQKLMGEEEYEEAVSLKCYGVKDNLLDYELTWK